MPLSIFNQLGLSDRELKVYTTLLRRGPMKPANLAKATNINRTTLYSLAKKLTGKGLISEDLTLPGTQLVANDPSSLSDLLTQERQQLKAKEATVNSAIDELSLIAKEADHPVPKIQFITEGQVEKFLFSQAKKWNTSAHQVDHTWWGFQDHQLVEKYNKWITWLWSDLYSKEDKVNLFSNVSQIEQKLKTKYKRRHIKHLKDNTKFTATTWVVGDYIIMVYLKANPIYLVEIHDATLAQNMRAVFTTLWSKIA